MIGVGGQDLLDPLGRGGGPLGLGDDHAEHPQRPDEHDDVDVERHERAEAQGAVQHLVAAVAEHGDQADVRQQLQRRQVASPDPGRVHRLAEHVVGLGREAAGRAPARRRSP